MITTATRQRGSRSPSTPTGLHRDYHYLTDEVGKIDFPKLAHITQLVYTTGWKVANLDHFPARDNKGPRKGKGTTGKIGS